jgi:cadmium resistance protein CadD (predicted permease)
MIDGATVVAVTAGAFIGTNLDNLVLLVAFYSRYQNRSRLVTAGYISGMILIGLIFFAVGEGGDFIPVSYLGLLGIVPVIMGLIALFQVFRPQPSDELSDLSIGSSTSAIFFTVLTTQLSNGADSIITFSIFLADSNDTTDYLITFTFLAMACIFAAVAYYSLKHRKLSDFLDHYGRYLTPFILIFVGLYILSDTASDLV